MRVAMFSVRPPHPGREIFRPPRPGQKGTQERASVPSPSRCRRRGWSTPAGRGDKRRRPAARCGTAASDQLGHDQGSTTAPARSRCLAQPPPALTRTASRQLLQTPHCPLVRGGHRQAPRPLPPGPSATGLDQLPPPPLVLLRCIGQEADDDAPKGMDGLERAADRLDDLLPFRYQRRGSSRMPVQACITKEY